MGADNQQERLDERWISGFVDGEGCFYVGINRQPKMSLGYQVLPEFRIVQHKRDVEILHRIKQFFGFGKVTVNHGDRMEFRVRGLSNLNRLLEFFEASPLQTTKSESFTQFKKIIELMNRKEHLTQDGLQRIAHLASTMNQRTKTRCLVSSETICQNSRVSE